jgi:copper homeostasis protein
MIEFGRSEQNMDGCPNFELCAESLPACLAARDGGAHRIELCSALREGGLTPSHGLIEAAIAQSGLPVHVLLRPRAGNFVYSEAEFLLMLEDLRHAATLGAKGFVAGVLDSSGMIDQRRMGRLVQLAGDLEVTFHRAFDTMTDLDDALAQVIATGCRRLLTSGGADDVAAGAERLRSFRELASGRIVIAAGGGLRVANAAYVAATSGLTDFHGSVRRPVQDDARDTPFGSDIQVHAEDVRAMIAELARGRTEGSLELPVPGAAGA